MLARRCLPLLFIITIFVSAWLLFMVQPMVAKGMLPYLGGAPAVWNTAMMFFQIMLLAGYIYAHITLRWLGPKKQAILHLALTIAALLFLPVTMHVALGFEPQSAPISWLLLVLFLSIAAPLFIITSNAPIIQQWYAHTRAAGSHNPYYLYSASNTGSMAALLAYPFLIEPAIGISAQLQYWSAGYVVLATGLLLCAASMWRWYAAPDLAVSEADEKDSGTPPGWRQRALWVALAFVPSSLMLGVTTYITTDIAAAPLFWVLPLSLYLLSFIMAFAHKPIGYDRVKEGSVFLIAITAVLLSLNVHHYTDLLVFHLCMFFAVALVCHGRLALHKPSVQHLTEFYLWLSLGGVLGGLFNALLSPMLFDDVIEYPLMVVLACLLRPLLKQPANKVRARIMDVAVPAILLIILAGMHLSLHWLMEQPEYFATTEQWLGKVFGDRATRTAFMIVFAMVAITIATMTFERPARLGLSIAAILVATPLFGYDSYQTRYKERNFFGVLSVQYAEERDVTMMTHGTTLHGMQSTQEEYRLQPVSYYGALIEVMDELPEASLQRPIAVLGLGVGTVACLAEAHQHMVFYEIDPAVVEMAQNPDYFTYMGDCPPSKEVVLGDGRLMIGQEPPGEFGMIVMDAFSSDAIPVHLLTIEAFKLYLTKLHEQGMIAVNISNRHVDLSGVLKRLANELGLAFRVKAFREVDNKLQNPSIWVLMARSEASFGALADEESGWIDAEPVPGTDLWTDDFSNIIGVLGRIGK